MLRRLTFLRTTRTLLAATLLAVCLAPLYAQRLKQPVATVLDFSGQVSVMDADGGMQAPLSFRLTVKQTQVIVTGPDGWAKFEYSDGSTFEIFPKSKVVFQEHPADWEHLLNVWIGHVKVWIQHAPGQPNYKNVNTPTAVISVRGTVFSIDVPDDDTTVVSVETGLVDVRNTTSYGNIPQLHDGQSVTVIRGVPLALNRNNNNNLILGKAIHAAEQAVYRLILQRRGGMIGLPGGPVGSTGGSPADKGKPTGTGTGNGAPTPPAAPTPPPAPPPPGGGH